MNLTVGAYEGGAAMKKITIVLVMLYCILYLGSSLPYEPQIKPPVETYPLIYNRQEEPEKALVPPRREVPEEYQAILDAASNSTGIPPGVLESIAFVESGFYSGAMSPLRGNGHRDLGMFQFNSQYLPWYADAYNGGVIFDPMSPRDAASVAAKHIRYLYNRYGHWPTVCLAYNAGMAAVDNDRIPECSYRYLIKIYEDF
jgi:soluble lytic murein transglycosylase-like protein